MKVTSMTLKSSENKLNVYNSGGFALLVKILLQRQACIQTVTLLLQVKWFLIAKSSKPSWDDINIFIMCLIYPPYVS